MLLVTSSEAILDLEESKERGHQNLSFKITQIHSLNFELAQLLVIPLLKESKRKRQLTLKMLFSRIRAGISRALWIDTQKDSSRLTLPQISCQQNLQLFHTKIQLNDTKCRKKLRSTSILRKRQSLNLTPFWMRWEGNKLRKRRGKFQDMSLLWSRVNRLTERSLLFQQLLLAI